MPVRIKDKKLSTQTALRERVKELACLYGISELAIQEKLSLHQLLERVLQLIPPAWQYPEHTVARITLDERHFDSGRVRKFPHRQSESILIRGKDRGSITVFYTKKHPRADEGPFLKEERNLIRAVAGKLALLIERKEAAENLKLLQEQIRHADRLATIGELTAGIAHELNNPLNSILGFAQLAVKNKSLPAGVKQDIEKIIKASLHSREIIKKLMYFTRQMPQHFTPTDVNAVVREAMNFLEPQCSKENIRVVYRLEKDLPPIQADGLQLQQVVVNLVVNAVQAMPKGGKLTLSSFRKDRSVFLAVEDTGTGIPEKILPSVFNPFFTTKDVGKGTGLGLSVVHGILTSLKAKIRVKSKEGSGTKFEIEFPVTSARA